MKFCTRLLVIAGLISLPAFAQDSAALNGNWVAKFNAPNGTALDAKVVIRDNGGTWQTVLRARTPNRCIGQEMPMAIGKVEKDSFEMNVFGSKAMNGCEDFTSMLKRVDDNNFEGMIGGGRKLTLTRQ